MKSIARPNTSYIIFSYDITLFNVLNNIERTTKRSALYLLFQLARN